MRKVLSVGIVLGAVVLCGWYTWQMFDLTHMDGPTLMPLGCMVVGVLVGYYLKWSEK